MLALPESLPVAASIMPEAFQRIFPIADPVDMLAVLGLLILLVPRLCRRTKLPPIVGLILAGVFLGPHGLGLLADADGLKFFSITGLLYIMFLAGLEIDVNQVRRHPQFALVFGSFTFFIPLLAGIVLGRYVFNFGWLASILLGSLFSSHTLIPYSVVSRLGLSKDSAVNATVGGTVFTDTLALLVLAVTTRMYQGEMSLAYALQLFIAGLLLVAASLWGLPRFARWFYRNLPIGEDAAEFLFLFATLFVFSALAHVAGFEPIIGAFLAGIALNHSVPHEGRLMNRVQFFGETIFIPIFLISVGMVVDLRALLFQGLGWQIAVSMSIAVIVTKFLAAQITRRVFRYTAEQTWIIFGLSINQAAATLAAVLIGHRIGLLNDAVLNGTILMILVTCVIGPWITEVYARRYAISLSKSSTPSVGAQRIMVTLNETLDVKPMVDLAALIRDTDSSHPIYPLSVAVDGDDTDDQLAAYKTLLGLSVMQATAADIPVHAEMRIDANEAAGIARATRELRVSCLLMTWDGDVDRKRIFGRILDRVISQVRQMLIVSHLGQPFNTYQRLVVIMPHLCDRLPGFYSAVKAVKNIIERSNRELLIVCPKDDVDIMREAFSPLPAATRFRPLARTSEQWSVLEDEVQRDDLFIPFSCRPDSLIWQPGLDRLPARLRNRFPDAGIMVVYPSETTASDTSMASVPDMPELQNVLAEQRFFPMISANTAEDLIQEQLKRYFETNHSLLGGGLDGLTRELLTSALEVEPGLIMMHVHCHETSSPTVLLGTCQQGVTFPEATKPCHAAFILLSPKDAPPEEHLRILGKMARLIMRLPGAGELALLVSFDELQQVLTPSKGSGTSMQVAGNNEDP